MKEVKLKCVGTSDLVEQVKKLLPKGSIIFRGPDSFVCYVNDKETGEKISEEVKLLPDLASTQAYNLLFQGVSLKFEGSVNVPDSKDLGLPEEVPSESPSEEIVPSTEPTPDIPPKSPVSPEEVTEETHKVRSHHKPVSEGGAG